MSPRGSIIQPASALGEGGPQAITAARDRVGESPVWSVAEQALYWVDIEGRHVHRYDWASGTQQSWNTPERVGCIALTECFGTGGGVIAAMESGIFALRFRSAPELDCECIARIAHPAPGMRFNDGRCDRAGRLWVGTMCMDMSLAAPVGAIYCLDEGGLRASGIDGLITPNGMAFSPNDDTMYLSDSHLTVQKIWAFDFDLASATASGRREFVAMAKLPGRPDGAAVDVHGNYWICANDAGQVHRFSPQGELVSSIVLPVSKPAMCAFGGPGLDVLFVTSIQPAAPSGADETMGGAVFALQAGVRGRPEPSFSRFPSDRAKGA